VRRSPQTICQNAPISGVTPGDQIVVIRR
jgi:hypothetical protein